MHTISIGSNDDYEKMQKGIKDTLQKAAKNSESKILKEHVDEMEREDDPDVEKKCRMVHMLVDEGLDMYECGDMEFGEMIADLCKALNAIE